MVTEPVLSALHDDAGAVAAIGLAVILVFVTVKSYKWVRLTLGDGSASQTATPSAVDKSISRNAYKSALHQAGADRSYVRWSRSNGDI